LKNIKLSPLAQLAGGSRPLSCLWSWKRKRSSDNFWAVGDCLVKCFWLRVK